MKYQSIDFQNSCCNKQNARAETWIHVYWLVNALLLNIMSTEFFILKYLLFLL